MNINGEDPNTSNGDRTRNEEKEAKTLFWERFLFTQSLFPEPT